MTNPITMPQRLVLRPAPIGSLLKSTTMPARTKRDAASERSPAHLVAIRQLPCLKCGLEPCGEAAHVRANSSALGKRNSLGAKPADMWSVPLDRGCHQDDPDALHKVGEAIFWQALGLNPLLIAQDLYRASPDLVTMRAIVFAAIAGRV